MSRSSAYALTVALAASTAARAHGVHEHAGAAWSLDPWIAPLMLASILLQLAGLARMGASARSRIAPTVRIAAYAAAQATLAIALFSPIDARADSSFAWHMAQHLLLMLVAAPLFAMSNMHHVAIFALPMALRRVAGRATRVTPGARACGTSARMPWLAALVFTLALWLWHAPSLYEAALRYPAVHALEHVMFVVTSGLFWRAISTVGDRRLSPGAAVVLVTLVGLQGGLMAALITLAPDPIYPSYAVSGGLRDQQIAGLLMWVPAGLIYLASTVYAIWKLVAGVDVRHAPRRYTSTRAPS